VLSSQQGRVWKAAETFELPVGPRGEVNVGLPSKEVEVGNGVGVVRHRAKLCHEVAAAQPLDRCIVKVVEPQVLCIAHDHVPRTAIRVLWSAVDL